MPNTPPSPSPAALFDNSYTRLPAHMFARLTPTPVPDPALLACNKPLAQTLGLDPAALTPDVIAGNTLLPGMDPIAQAYAGHQFGNFVPSLGDGRALLLGEITPPTGRHDIVLKGAGPTPFSRNGDGRAALGPILREYILCEAMHALAIPTTRALAAATTGARVQRERALPGATLLRVAKSHIRVGTFQYFAARNDTDALRALLDHSLKRHSPTAKTPAEFLAHVVAAQADLIAAWMSFGFIHGVMNTDNMTISGETIDYGPCAFLDAFNPKKCFSSIDHMGRYAYDAQPNMALWNLAQLANALLPLFDDEDAAIDELSSVLDGFAPAYRAHWLRRFRAKIGLRTEEDGDEALITGLLSRMATSRADFTATFAALRQGDASAHLTDQDAWDSWAPNWRARCARDANPAATMATANPILIARNHQVEAAIQAALAGDLSPFETLTTALQTPFSPAKEHLPLAAPPRPEEEVAHTFCGT